MLLLLTNCTTPSNVTSAKRIKWKNWSVTERRESSCYYVICAFLLFSTQVKEEEKREKKGKERKEKKEKERREFRARRTKETERMEWHSPSLVRTGFAVPRSRDFSSQCSRLQRNWFYDDNVRVFMRVQREKLS